MAEQRDSIEVNFNFGLRPTRREFLAYIGALLAASACGSERGTAGAAPPPAPVLASDPFTLGVASGDPLPDSVILWTRLAMDPINGGGMPAEDIPVIWEVATDREFRQLVSSGWLYASPELAHSVHVDVDQLAPDSWYFYRMRVGDQWTSPVGRTRTLPAADSSPQSFRVALASCQNYRNGYYNAHAFMAQEDVDLVFFVGDYIYETGVGDLSSDVRLHEGPTPTDLPGYRNRYALYKTDPDLLSSHLAFPWVATWDDHEVANNYAGLHLNEDPEEEVLIRRRAAYQAYYEHLPLRVSLPDDFGFLKIYRSFEVGDLASVSVLDTRQYRDDQACMDRPGPICSESQDPSRTIMGAEQKQWLKDRLRQSTQVWNVIAQQVIVAPIKFNRTLLNPDQWDGYPVERQEMLDVFGERRNVVVLTGDIHAAGFAVLPANAADLSGQTVGYEVVGTSISSGGDLPLENLKDLLLPQNPHLHHLNAANRGYAICAIERGSITVEYRIVDTVRVRGGVLSTDAAFRIDRETFSFEAL